MCTAIAALIPPAQERCQLGPSPTLAEVHLATVWGAVRGDQLIVDHVVHGNLDPGEDCNRAPQQAGRLLSPLWTGRRQSNIGNQSKYTYVTKLRYFFWS